MKIIYILLAVYISKGPIFLSRIPFYSCYLFRIVFLRVGISCSLYLSAAAAKSSRTMSSSSSKMIVLKSSDGKTFEVEEAVALESQTIKHMIEDNCADGSIPLPNVTGNILAKVTEYCKKHAEAEDKDAEDLKVFDAEFMKVDSACLFDLICAANYLNIKGLLDLTCQTVAAMMKGKSVDEIRKIFNIKNDFSPEEEEEIRRENSWAFE